MRACSPARTSPSGGTREDRPAPHLATAGFLYSARLGSVCPYVIVHDLLSGPSLARLQHAFGSRRLFALEDLKSAAEASSRNASISSSARLVTNASTSETAGPQRPGFYLRMHPRLLAVDAMSSGRGGRAYKR